MSYLDKYIKYKAKYVSIRDQQIGGNNDSFNVVDKCPDIEPSKVVHLKGYASGLITENTDELQNKVIEFIKQFDVLVWDGDNYDIKSFTMLIPKIPKIKLCAFVKEEDVDRFKKSWCNSCMITIVKAPNNLQWDELGIHALKATNAQNVVTLGGGDTLKKEYETFKDKNIKWHVFDFARTVVQHTSLISAASSDPNIMVTKQ